MITWEELRNVIAANCSEETKELEITLDTRLIEDLKFDSVAIMELFTDIEEKFGIDITDLEDFDYKFNLCKTLLDGINELRNEVKSLSTK